MYRIILLLSVFIFTSANETMESKLDAAYQNAKKGIYHALENIPEAKLKYSKDLIDGNELIAEVTLYRENNGVKIMSVGHYGSYSVEARIYRSFDSLKEEGYIVNAF